MLCRSSAQHFRLLHQLTHQVGVAGGIVQRQARDEQRLVVQQLGVLLGLVRVGGDGGLQSGDDVYAYSGWLSGYIYLGNALYRGDPDAYWAIRNALPETVITDLRDNNAYWAQFQDGAAQKVSNKVYEGFLKSYGEERGLQSYGTVVDMLVVYYKDQI